MGSIRWSPLSCVRLDDRSTRSIRDGDVLTVFLLGVLSWKTTGCIPTGGTRDSPGPAVGSPSGPSEPCSPEKCWRNARLYASGLMNVSNLHRSMATATLRLVVPAGSGEATQRQAAPST